MNDSTAAEPDVRGVLAHGLISPVFQPVVDLDSGLPVGFEALARGPAGSPMETPAALFDNAHRHGLIRELDWLCRESAVAASRTAGLRYPLSLFINAEPATLDAAGADAARWASFANLRCYAELTERALLHRPAELLRTADQVRAQDWGIALDDIGADPASLALMPLLQPDVLKLDLALLADQPDLDTARIVHAVLAQAADTGAAVIAEGIETERQLDTARGYGVGYGQGFRLGRPGPLPDPLTDGPAAVPLLPRLHDRTVVPGPFAVVAGRQNLRQLPRIVVLELARQLLDQAAALQPPPVLLAAQPAGDPFPDPLLHTLTATARRLPLAALLGAPANALAGLRTAALAGGDPAAADLAVVVVSPHYAAALVARHSLGHDDGDAYDTALSFFRETITSAANALLARLPAADSPG